MTDTNTIYLVCESSRGAHEPSGIYSVWTTLDQALAEADALLFQDDTREIEIAEAIMNQPFLDNGWGEPWINYGPPSLAMYRSVHDG